LAGDTAAAAVGLSPYSEWSRGPRVGIAVPVAAALGVAAFVIANGWSGLMPGVGFWDTGEFQTVLPILGTAHPTGFPTYVLLGFIANLLLTPIGEPAFRINALSLLAVAGAAGLMVELVRRLTGSIPIGIATGIGLALTPDVWANATRADPHPIHLFFVALLLVLLVGWELARRNRSAHADRWLVAAAAGFGLSAGNHSLTLLLAPPIALYVLAVDPGVLRRVRLIGACVAALAVTIVGVYLELPIRSGLLPAPLVYGSPDTWDGFWYIALAEQFRGSLSQPFDDLVGKAGDLWSFAAGQLGWLVVLVLPGFLAALGRAPRYALLTGLAMVITVIFNAAYSNADINRYYLGPILFAWTWIAILGVSAVEWLAAGWAWLTSRGRRGRGLAVAATGLSLVVAIAILVPSAQGLGAARQAADRHLDTTAGQWLDAALPKIEPNAVVISWWSTSTPLWYAQLVQGRRTDIDVVDDRTVLDRGYGSAMGAIGRFFGKRPVYVIRATGQDIAQIGTTYELAPVAGAGSLAVYRVVAVLTSSGG
jgi:hypothetical protein